MSSNLGDDNITSGINSIKISPQVQSAIEEILSCDDPLDKAEFNSVDYINTLFPTEQSLANIDDVMNRMKEKIRQLDEEIRVVVRGQNIVEQEGKQALEEARKVIIQLASRIQKIKEEAKKSEQIVNEITCDIKQLDNAKRNLTASIITLNNLNILVEGTDRLQEATKKKQYGQAASILQGVMDVLHQFEKHKHISHISQLSSQVETLRTQLAQQILEDFRLAFEGPITKNSFSPNLLQLLAEGCLVVSILDMKVKRELLSWFVDIELSEYKTLFQENQDVAWLDKIDKRFSWLKKHLIEFEERFGRMFPPSWEVSECIAVEFCKITRKDLTKVMTNRAHELNVNLLLPAIAKAAAFEKLLSQRFTGITLTQANNNSSVSVTDRQFRVHPFAGQITQCFENHLNIYVEAQDKNLSKLIDQFIEEHQKLSKNDFVVSEVFISSGKLFTQYKNCLVQCVALSNRQPLVSLTNTFQKYLREYSNRILQANLPRVGGAMSSIASLSSTITSAANTPSGVLSAASSAAGLIQSLLKEGETNRFTKSELCQICSILLTANYCLETTQQLEKKLQEKVDSSLIDKINLNYEQDLFHMIITNSIQLLIQDIEAGCEPAFNTMIKTQWANVETPIGYSSYITTMTAHLQQIFPFIRDNLQEVRKYFTLLCNKFAATFTPKYITNLFKCKPLSQGGAEQLLLDTHTLKKVLMELPCWDSVVKTAPAIYTKTVIKGMTKAEMILKVVLVPHERIDNFIESYNKLLPDSDNIEFQRILEMKGVKRPEFNLLLEAYKNRPKEVQQQQQQQQQQQPSENLNNSNEIQINDQSNENSESSRIKRLEKLIKKRL